MNAAWHRENILGRSATRDERVAWHLEHRRVCACRPPPASLAAYLGADSAASPVKKKPPQRGAKRVKAPARGATQKRATVPDHAPASAAGPEGRFAQVVEALCVEPGVTHGGKGFGSRGLKVHGKLFAMLDTRRQFVAKLPRDRVSRLIAAGKGTAFESGGGRVMKEWVAIPAAASGNATAWTRLAREALRFVRGP
jgi:hypothetical protein